jgi:Type IV secretory system Conjugative DNA transfer
MLRRCGPARPIFSNDQVTGKTWSTGRTRSNSTVSETGRRLYKPEEIMTLPDRFALVIHRNLPVIPAWLVRYYDHPAFRNGGTGRQAGLGRVATEMTLWLLLASVAFAALVASLFLSSSDPFGPVIHRTHMARPGATRRASRGGGPYPAPPPVTEVRPFV